MDNLTINTLRFLAAEAIQKAKSGHPGLPLGAAPAAYTLWAKELKANPANPNWDDRDRFILSAGHGSALLYSLLHVFGYGLTIEDLKNFRQRNSLTPGHPEYKHTTGVEVTTGPLGQGIANAVGMALAESHLAAKFNTPEFKVVDHYTYALCGDGTIYDGCNFLYHLNEISAFLRNQGRVCGNAADYAQIICLSDVVNIGCVNEHFHDACLLFYLIFFISIHFIRHPAERT